MLGHPLQSQKNPQKTPKPKLLHLVNLTTKKEAQCLVSFLGFWKQHIPHLGILLQPRYQGQGSVAAPGCMNKQPCCLDYMIRHSLWFWRCQWWNRYSGIYGIPQLENLNARPWGSERSPSYLWQRETHCWKTIRSSWGDDWGQGKFRVRVGRRAVRHTSCKKGCSSSQEERPTGVPEGCSWLETWIPVAQEWPVGTKEVCCLDLPSGENLPFSCETADSLQGQCLHRMSQLSSQDRTLPWWSSEWLSMVGLPGPDLFCPMWNSSDTQPDSPGFHDLRLSLPNSSSHFLFTNLRFIS